MRYPTVVMLVGFHICVMSSACNTFSDPQGIIDEHAGDAGGMPPSDMSAQPDMRPGKDAMTPSDFGPIEDGGMLDAGKEDTGSDDTGISDTSRPDMDPGNPHSHPLTVDTNAILRFDNAFSDVDKPNSGGTIAAQISLLYDGKQSGRDLLRLGWIQQDSSSDRRAHIMDVHVHDDLYYQLKATNPPMKDFGFSSTSSPTSIALGVNDSNVANYQVLADDCDNNNDAHNTIFRGVLGSTTSQTAGGTSDCAAGKIFTGSAIAGGTNLVGSTEESARWFWVTESSSGNGLHSRQVDNVSANPIDASFTHDVPPWDTFRVTPTSGHLTLVRTSSGEAYVFDVGDDSLPIQELPPFKSDGMLDLAYASEETYLVAESSLSAAKVDVRVYDVSTSSQMSLGQLTATPSSWPNITPFTDGFVATWWEESADEWEFRYRDFTPPSMHSAPSNNSVAIPFDAVEVYGTDAVTFESVEGHIVTVVAVVNRPFDNSGVFIDLIGVIWAGVGD